MQSPWHDAGFLLGTITEPQYRNQPCQVYLDERLDVMKAIYHDLNGEPGQAVEFYQSFIANNASGEKLLREPELREFMTWRLYALRSQ